MLYIVTKNLKPSSSNLALVGFVQGALDVLLRNSLFLFVLDEKENEAGSLKQTFEAMGVPVTRSRSGFLKAKLNRSLRLVICNMETTDKVVKEIARDGIPHCCISHANPDTPPTVSIGAVSRERRRLGTFGAKYRQASLTELGEGSAILSLPKLLEWLEDFETEKQMSRFIQTMDSNSTNLPSIAELAIDDSSTGKLPEEHLKKLARPICAVFSHSLERNGANNFLLFLTKKLNNLQEFVLFSPKPGPMQQDFEVQGVSVEVADAESKTYLSDLETRLEKLNAGVIICNTILRADVVTLTYKMKIPTLWVIHEAWPQNEIEHYAKDVFMMRHIDAPAIKAAFKLASTVVFPSNIQKDIYRGLFDEDRAVTIYNGIPLAAMDQFAKSNDRDAVRAALGYSKEDFLVLHLGTICFRKGQIYSAQAFASLVTEKKVKNAKLLMVGARYIRDHEIKYIEEIKSVLEKNKITWARFEDTKEEDRGKAQVTLMDIQSKVYRFYMAADVVVVPSLNEVLPLVVCEAMSFKKPVIATKIAGIPEAMDDGKEGYLIEPEKPQILCDLLHNLYKSPDLRKQLGTKGRQRVLQQFAYDVMGRQYRVLMDEMCGAMKKINSNVSIVTMASEKSEIEEIPAEEKSELNGIVVLVDLDNTITDWDQEFCKRFAKLPNCPKNLKQIVENRELFSIEDNFPKELKESCFEVIRQEGFYLDIPPIPGSIEAVQEMVAAGIDVRLVSSPHVKCPMSISNEKYIWVEKHLGASWCNRLIIVRDKRYVSGVILIDDTPDFPKTETTPTWKHVVFDRSYNRKVAGKPRLGSWAGWRQAVSAAFRAA